MGIQVSCWQPRAAIDALHWTCRLACPWGSYIHPAGPTSKPWLAMPEGQHPELQLLPLVVQSLHCFGVWLVSSWPRPFPSLCLQVCVAKRMPL